MIHQVYDRLPPYLPLIRRNAAKALFGPYRHVLERRGDSVLEATMSVWEPYVSKILHALDGMPGEAEVDRSLLVRRAIKKHWLFDRSISVNRWISGRLVSWSGIDWSENS